MPSKDSGYYERRIKRLQKQIDAGTELRHAHQAQVVKYKDSMKGLLENQIRAARIACDELAQARDTLASNSMTIRELNDQLAVQWKQRAEAVSDVNQARETASRAAAAHNRLVGQIEELRRLNDESYGEIRRVTEDRDAALQSLHLAKLSLQYRVYQWFIHAPSRYRAKLRFKWKNLVSYIHSWYLVRRLSAGRRQALYEAGYAIPEKLIKAAHAYYVHDKERRGA